MTRLKTEQSEDEWLREMNLEEGQPKNRYKKDSDGIIRYGKREDARLVIPASMREEVMDSNHNYILAGHGGMKKTYARIGRTYFWPNMQEDINDYCNRCHLCLRKKDAHIKKSPLHPLIAE